MIVKTYLIFIRGLVQGVGFRPFIYRLAHERGLKGWVNNTSENVQVMLNADMEMLEAFIRMINENPPPASRIESIDFTEQVYREFSGFDILESESLMDSITEVSPDIAVCSDCLEDMKHQANRIAYPFLNCTNCGPRFTIIRDLPYDRSSTTMSEFTMCESCLKEYEDVLDRRFHAQPTACRDCGPRYNLIHKKDPEERGSVPPEETELIQLAAGMIQEGKLLAVKGLGGFFMACDAGNEEAVKRLRGSKLREGKPFAVMFRDIESIERYCLISEEERKNLESWRRPITVLRNKNGSRELAPSVSNGFPTTGVMLPYMPLHYLLFERLGIPAIVFTSGNLAEEPIIIDNHKAEIILGPVTDAVLTFNRDIYNRCDDSVCMVMNGSTRLLRRSRGYVPSPIPTLLDTEGIFAAGAELVNCFAVGKGNHAIMSQHIGDLKNYETFEFYTETFERFARLFRFKPVLAVHDHHPDYLSTRFAGDLGIQTLGVQHHHAHIASVMAEHQLDEKVIGVSFDGTGLGDDGNIWGSEFMVCDLERYRRISHLEYLPMPGGDKSTQEPWRLAISLLYNSYGGGLGNQDLSFLRQVDPKAVDLVIQSIEKNINCPLSSGAGRLFDAVSALLNLCTVSGFHAEAPMRLEAAIRQDEGSYPFSPGNVIGTSPLLEGILRDISHKVDPGTISARFHNTMAAIITETVSLIGKDHGLKKVVLSGGTFQNRYLSERVEKQLEGKGFEVLLPQKLPANDGGIALGQLAIAAKTFK